MKIYIFKWHNFKRINSTKNLNCVQIVFKKWKQQYKYLNYLFLPQKTNKINWFWRLFKNIELVFLPEDIFEEYLNSPSYFGRLVRII